MCGCNEATRLVAGNTSSSCHPREDSFRGSGYCGEAGCLSSPNGPSVSCRPRTADQHGGGVRNDLGRCRQDHSLI